MLLQHKRKKECFSFSYRFLENISSTFAFGSNTLRRRLDSILIRSYSRTFAKNWSSRIWGICRSSVFGWVSSSPRSVGFFFGACLLQLHSTRIAKNFALVAFSPHCGRSWFAGRTYWFDSERHIISVGNEKYFESFLLKKRTINSNLVFLSSLLRQYINSPYFFVKVVTPKSALGREVNPLTSLCRYLPCNTKMLFTAQW